MPRISMRNVRNQPLHRSSLRFFLEQSVRRRRRSASFFLRFFCGGAPIQLSSYVSRLEINILGPMPTTSRISLPAPLLL